MIHKENLFFLLSFVTTVQVQAILFGDEVPTILLHVVDAYGTSRVSIAVGGVVDGATAEF